MPNRATPRRAAVPLAALLLSIGFLSVAVGAAALDHGRDRDALDRALTSEAREQSEKLEHYFSRARSLTLITARNPAFRTFYEEPGARRAKVVAGGGAVRESNEALAYLEDLFPGSIGEACFIDRSGPENARAVKGKIAPLADLSPDETKASFFRPAFALRAGQVFQAKPYVSPDTHEWVVANATPIPTRDGSKPAIVHFEVTMESFRLQAAETSDRFDVAILEARSGKVIADSRYPQPVGDESALGRPFDRRFVRFASAASHSGDGTIDVQGKPGAFTRLERGEHNENEWVVVAVSRKAGASWVAEFGLLEIAMSTVSLLLLGFAVLSFRSSQAHLRTAALTDPLTGLGNRRALMEDLEARLATASNQRALVLAIFDLDGFKSYNDTFGHPAGDALLVRMAGALRSAMEGRGTAYRMGGDEFCVLAQVGKGGAPAVLEAAGSALSEHGEGFSISSSHGVVTLPIETNDAAEALRAADQRMYASKSTGRASAGRQSRDVLVSVLSERDPDLGEHLDEVAALSEKLADKLELPEEQRATLLQAASLHDIGKAAIPDAILTKPGPLDEEEWAFVRQHTLIGERILGVAPALTQASRLVRWTHERMDGSGYPDGLKGDEIPLGARIIAVCDAYDAMTSPRPYRPTAMSPEGAVAELRRAAGTQFDPAVVDAFCALQVELGRSVQFADARD